jgi:hypothetical protein
VAKLHKLADRSGEREPRRLKDKDALDVLRLLRATRAERLAGAVREMAVSGVASDVTREGGHTSPDAVRSDDRTRNSDGRAGDTAPRRPGCHGASCVALVDELISLFR